MIEIKVSGQDINELKLNLFAATQALFIGDFNEPGKSKFDFGFKRECEREIGSEAGTTIVQETTPLEATEIAPKKETTRDSGTLTGKTPARKPNKKTTSGESKPKAEVKGKLKVPVEKLVEKEDVYVEPEEVQGSITVTKVTATQIKESEIIPVSYDQATITAILQKVVAAHGMRAAKTIINSYGATRIGELPQEKYKEFADKCLSKLQEPVSEDRFATK